MCQLPWHVQWWGKGSLSKLQPGSTHHQIPSPPSALAQALFCPRAQLYFPLIALIPASDFQGTELKLCSVWPWKAKNSIEPLSSLFFIWSGLEPKAASLVLENSNRFPLHGVYLKRNKDNELRNLAPGFPCPVGSSRHRHCLHREQGENIVRVKVSRRPVLHKRSCAGIKCNRPYCAHPIFFTKTCRSV